MTKQSNLMPPDIQSNSSHIKKYGPIIPVAVIAVLIIYGLRRAEDNPRAGPPCTVLVEVDLEPMAKANKEGNLDDRYFKLVLEDGTTRQRLLVSELQTFAYSENLNIIQWVGKGEQHEVRPDSDVSVTISPTITLKSQEEHDGGVVGMRFEYVTGESIPKIGNLGEYEDHSGHSIVRATDVSSAARRWRQSHFYEFIL
jgi:hypothetical protein